MVTRGNAPGYAAERVDHHAGHLHRLCDAIERDAVDDGEVTAIAARDDAPHDVSALLAALDPAGTSAAPGSVPGP
jgi:predicted glycosyl hydrolase (DUF1957 family)